MQYKKGNIWNIITTAVLYIMVIFAVLVYGVKLLGVTPFCVLSRSMEPVYKKGSLIYVKKIDAQDVKEKDPITFYFKDGKTVATHRVVRIDTEKQQFYTKGDANNTEDVEPVSFNNLIGKPIFTIPYLGYISSYFKTPPGSYILITVVCVTVFGMFVLEFAKKKK